MNKINKNLFKNQYKEIKKSEKCLMKTERNYLQRIKVYFIFFWIITFMMIFSQLINDLMWETIWSDLLYSFFVYVWVTIFMVLFFFIFIYFIETKWIYLSRDHIIDVKKKKIIKNNNIHSILIFTKINNRWKSYSKDYFIQIRTNEWNLEEMKTSFPEYTVMPYVFSEYLL